MLTVIEPGYLNHKPSWYLNIADDLEIASKNNNKREVNKKKNILIGKSSTRVIQIRDSSGNAIKDGASRLQRWAEYFEGLLKAGEPKEFIYYTS